MRLLGQFQAFSFFYEEILHAQKSIKKHKKAQKSIKSIKSTNANKPTFTQMCFMRIKSIKSTKSDFHSDVFYAYKKHKKAQNVKQAVFFLLDIFYANKNAVCFVLHIKKHKNRQKAHEKHKNANKRGDFLPLRCFLSA